jgi:hypothetical protein
MKTEALIIKLDVASGYVDFEPSDWLMCPREYGLMHHQPTKTDYFVDLPAEAYANADKEVSIFEFVARLVSVPDNAPIPSIKEQTDIGRGAIAVFLQQSGLWKPKIVSDRPKSRGKRKDRKLVK